MQIRALIRIMLTPGGQAEMPDAEQAAVTQVS